MADVGTTDSVFVVQHDGMIHVMKSVASFPVDGCGSDDANAAANQLRGVVGTAVVTKVERSKLPIANLILV